MKMIIVDIDGTLSKVDDRLWYLKRNPPDWDEFYARCGEDKPIDEIVSLVIHLSKFYKVVFCTGRRESCRTITEKWLNDHGLSEYHSLLMRENADHRHDVDVKPELLLKAGITIGANDIAFVIEDRNSMVKKWRELGLTCIQVAEGDF